MFSKEKNKLFDTDSSEHILHLFFHVFLRAPVPLKQIMNISPVSGTYPVFHHGLVHKLTHGNNVLCIFFEIGKVLILHQYFPQERQQITGNPIIHLLFVVCVIFGVGKLTYKRDLLLPLCRPL